MICIHCGEPIFDNGTVYVHHRLLGLQKGKITVLHTQWCDEDTRVYTVATAADTWKQKQFIAETESQEE